MSNENVQGTSCHQEGTGTTYVVEQVLIVEIEVTVAVGVPQLEQLPTGPTGVVSQALIVTVETDAGTTLVTGVHEVSGPTAHEVTRLVIVAVAVEQVPTPPTVFDDADVQSTHDDA